MNLKYFKLVYRDEGVAWCFKITRALAEDPGSVTSTYMLTTIQ